MLAALHWSKLRGKLLKQRKYVPRQGLQSQITPYFTLAGLYISLFAGRHSCQMQVLTLLRN